MDLARTMEVFVAVVDSGSFVGAAGHLNMSNAAVTRQVSSLEDYLGVRLLSRTTRNLSVLEPGQVFYDRAQQILSDIAETRSSLGTLSSSQTGTLRIAAPVSFGISKLSKWLPAFIARHPNLHLDIELTDRVVDLTSDGIDVALRTSRIPASSNLIVRKIVPMAVVICAAPAYLKRYGTPNSPAELSSHATLGYPYTISGDTWTLRNDDGAEEVARLHPNVRSTSADLLRKMAIAGLGITAQARYIVEDDVVEGRLVPILTDWHIEGFNLYAIYASRKFLSAKVRTFIDFLVEVSEGKSL